MQKNELSPEEKSLLDLMRSIQYGRIFYLKLAEGRIRFLPETERVDDFKLGTQKKSARLDAKDDFELKKEAAEFFRRLREVKNGIVEVVEIKRGLPDIFRVRRKVA
jgi:hypothetical protein